MKQSHRLLLTIALLCTTGCTTGYRTDREAEELRLNAEVDRLIDVVQRLKNEEAELRVAGHPNVVHMILLLEHKHPKRFNFHLLDFTKPFPHGVDPVARADLKAGYMNYLTAGLSVFGNYENLPRFEKKYGIRVIPVGYCTEGRAFYDFIRQYNRVVNGAVKKKHGKSVGELYEPFEAGNK